MLSPEARRALFLHSVFYLAHGYQENRGAIIETAIRGLLVSLEPLHNVFALTSTLAFVAQSAPCRRFLW